MLVENIFMELRSRLRSCNVFITTGIDFSKDCNLKISIQAQCIALNYYNDDRSKRRDSLSSIESLSDCYSDEDSDVTTIIPVEEFCHIIPNSMSCLRIDKNTVSFRILTEPINGGNFFTEFISTGAEQKIAKVNELDINLTVENDVKILCANCSNVISNSFIQFKRILELPTSNLDITEWFCHGHGHNSQNDLTVKQNKLDFLYRLTHFVINNNMLSEKTNKFNGKRDVYHCNRCLAWLGLKNNDTVKLYNSEVKVHHDSTDKYVFSHKNPVEDISTDDFIYTIEKMIKEFNLGMQYAIMCKIVLECTISAANKQYLLIWVMDKELQVLRNIGDHIDNEKILLQSSFLTKILYKIETSLNDEVEAWLADPGVVSADISKSMFCNGIQHLQNMSLRMPEVFRNTNGYCVSYLKV